MLNLSIGGFTPLTTIDYPDHLSAVIFLQGCPLSCIYCHNTHLKQITQTTKFDFFEILENIKARKTFLDAVVFSGGEPLIHNELETAINYIKELNLKVGLHTSGILPNQLKKIITKTNWVGLDIKHTFEKYCSITNVKNSGDAALESLNILLNSNVTFETRLTADTSISIDDILKTAHTLSNNGVKTFVLQKCRDNHQNIVEHPIFSAKITLDEIKNLFDIFFVR